MLPCPKYKTTNQTVYIFHEKYDPTAKTSKLAQTDPCLLSGHYANNLNVDRVQHLTKSWPRAMDWREEYAQYVHRLKECKPRKYRRNFEKPPIDYAYIKDCLKNERCSEYCVKYCRGKFLSLRQQQDTCGPAIDCTNRFYATTYRNSYIRPLEVDCLLDKREPAKIIKRDIDETTRDNMIRRQISKKLGRTTYYETICIPALLYGDDEMPLGHIDRHHLRKV